METLTSIMSLLESKYLVKVIPKTNDWRQMLQILNECYGLHVNNEKANNKDVLIFSFKNNTLKSCFLQLSEPHKNLYEIL